MGPPSHLPGGRTGPFHRLPLWAQLAQPLLGLLLVLWDPESHRNKGSVRLSRHSPSPTDRSRSFVQARPLLPHCGTPPPAQVTNAPRGLDRGRKRAPRHLPHCTQGCRAGGGGGSGARGPGQPRGGTMGFQVNPVLTSQEPEMGAPTPTANPPSTESPSNLCIPSLHHLCNLHDVPHTRDPVLQTHTNVT